MRWYPWLDVNYNQILRFYRRDKGHHALLLNSKWDNGEDSLIKVIIRWLYCSTPNDTQYCNTCYDCKLMNAGNHPDYYELNPDHNKTIGVDVVRFCIYSIHKYSYRSRVKIIHIKYVEYLTDSAINALLKTLDDPPINTYFFFKTKDCERMSSTLLSRCMRWSVAPPVETLGLQWLMEQRVVFDKVLAKSALRLCDGSPIEAESMFKSEAWKRRSELCKFMNDTVLNEYFLQLVPFLNIYKNNTYYLYWFITILVDALKWKYGLKENFITNLDQIKLITIIADNWNVLSLSKQVQQWLILWRNFQEFINIDRELLLTYRLLNWQQGIVES